MTLARRFFALIFLTLAGLAALVSTAMALETSARAVLVMDQKTGTVLMSKNADIPLPPASMSKLMTLNMVFEALEQGRLTLDERLPVSKNAMSYKGSTMFLNTTDRVRVEDLIRGVIVLSGNDACVVLAEALSPDGTEAGFAREMTKRARQLGMNNSTFVNSNGWPAEGQRMSMRDLVILSNRLITVFPQYYKYFSEKEFAFDGRAPDNRFNRNPLLKLNIGADGLKTGHTVEAGFGLVGSAVQGDRRVIFAFTGMETAADRSREAERLVTWAFRQFAMRKMFDAGKRIALADVWMGKENQVGLVSQTDIAALVPFEAENDVSITVSYTGPLQAPVLKDTEVATLTVTIPDMEPLIFPLVTEQDVARGGLLKRLTTSAKILAKEVTGGSMVLGQ
jgi:serine-type D-Ala-D-Ala carboxypeptidase (penicillin-binding protein 5/6)